MFSRRTLPPFGLLYSSNSGRVIRKMNFISHCLSPPENYRKPKEYRGEGGGGNFDRLASHLRAMIIPFFASKLGNLRLRPQRPTGSLADLTSDFAFTFGPFAMHANIYRVTFAAADLPIRSSICFYELECSVIIVLDFPQIKIIIKPAGSSPVPVSPPFLL